MSREIQSDSDYAEKLIKLIPSEIVAAFLTIDGIVSTQPGIRYHVSLFASVFLLLLIPFYLKYVLKVKSVLQIIITMLSFAVWVFSIGGPFLSYGWYLQSYGAVALILWTVTVTMFKYAKE